MEAVGATKVPSHSAVSRHLSRYGFLLVSLLLRLSSKQSISCNQSAWQWHSYFRILAFSGPYHFHWSSKYVHNKKIIPSVVCSAIVSGCATHPQGDKRVYTKHTWRHKMGLCVGRNAVICKSTPRQPLLYKPTNRHNYHHNNNLEYRNGGNPIHLLLALFAFCTIVPCKKWGDQT